MKLSLPCQIVLLFLLVFTFACKKEKPQAPTKAAQEQAAQEQAAQKQASGESPELKHLINAMKTKQANGLGAGSVKVNGAWTYTGYSFLDPVQGARLVAVDVTVSGHTPAFDFDDIEIVGGPTLISYGSDPHITLLSPEGKALPDIRQMPAAPNPVRVLLIYGFPLETESFTLYYWGKNLLLKNHGIEPSGWELPFPKTEAPKTE